MTFSINDTQHKQQSAKRCSANMLSVIILSVTFYYLLCWMSSCWVLLCWVLLCWVSWRLLEWFARYPFCLFCISWILCSSREGMNPTLSSRLDCCLPSKASSWCYLNIQPGNTKGGSFTVPLTSCLTGLDYSVLQIKTKIVSCHTADSKPVKQNLNGTVILNYAECRGAS